MDSIASTSAQLGRCGDGAFAPGMVFFSFHEEVEEKKEREREEVFCVVCFEVPQALVTALDGFT